MKIVSWNVNGLRSVQRHGFSTLVPSFQADVLCLQEIKIQEDQLTDSLRTIPGFTSLYHCAAKKGYSGVAVYAKTPPERVIREIGHDRFDQEGRMFQLDYPDFTLLNLYLPHGGRQKENLGYKLECYERLLGHLAGLDQKRVVLAGDFNIAHSELDLARPKQNRNNIMFTPEERAQLDRLEALGFRDTFRTLHPEEQAYTWWPWLASARENNIGWRLDYLFASADCVLDSASILREVRGSDHCPIAATLSPL